MTALIAWHRTACLALAHNHPIAAARTEDGVLRLYRERRALLLNPVTPEAMR